MSLVIKFYLGGLMFNRDVNQGAEEAALSQGFADLKTLTVRASEMVTQLTIIIRLKWPSQ